MVFFNMIGKKTGTAPCTDMKPDLVPWLCTAQPLLSGASVEVDAAQAQLKGENEQNEQIVRA
jgi:hypothetical protein